MRTRRLWPAMLIGLVMALLLTAVAGAVPKDRCPGHPSCADDTTTPWTCVARARNGASAWVIGEWVAADGTPIEYFDRTTLEGDPTAEDVPEPDHYRSYVDERFGVPACFDIHPAHVDVTTWHVTWNPAPGSSTNTKAQRGGLKVQFEREVHAGVFWEDTIRSVESGDLVASWDHPGGGLKSLVFVAMPSHRDSWVFDAEHRLTVTPCLGPCP